MTNTTKSGGLPRFPAEIPWDQLASFYCNLPVMLHTADATGCLSAVSDLWVENLGYSRTEVIGRKATEFLSVAAREYAENVCFPRFLNSGQIRNEKLQFIRRDGEPLDILLSAIADIDAAGNIVRSIAISVDITDCKNAERALSESKTRMRQLFESANDAVLILEYDGRTVVEGNVNASNLFGYSTAELPGTDLHSLYPDDTELVEDIWRELSANKAARSKNLSCRTREGRDLPADIAFSLISTNGGDLVLAVIRDMSDELAAQRQMKCYQQKLRSLSMELSAAEEHERRRLASDLHDSVAQTLLVAGLTLSELRMSEKSESLSAELEQVQTTINQAITETRTVLYELCPPVLHDLGFEAALKWKLEQFSEAHDIEVVFLEDSREKPMSDSFSIFLFKAAQELLTNVTKHANASHVDVSLKVDGDYVRLEISDNGQGFNESDNEPCANPSSSFGLFNIRDRLDYYGGEFKIRSSPGQGCQIVLWVPLRTD